MRDGWVETTLGNVLEPLNLRAGHSSSYQVLSVTEKRGIIPQSQVFNHRIATEDISKYKVLNHLDIAFNPYLLWCGAIGQWKSDLPGVVSPVYECFRPRENQNPRYWGLVLESGLLTPYFDSTAIGSIQRRRRTTLDVFIAAPVKLPPLVEQKRIVDVVSSVDSYIDSLQQQVDGAKTARNAVLHELLTSAGDDWTETTLSEIATSSWGNTSVTKSKYRDSGFVAFSASGPDGLIDWFEHDGPGVVLSAIGALCGKTWFANGKWTPIKNTIWFKSKSEQVLTEYLFLLSQIPNIWPIRGQAQPFISLGDVREKVLLVAPLNEQKRIVDIVSSMDDVLQSAEQALTDAKNLRSGLLSDLLSGNHAIPESYDEIMGAA